MIRLPVSRKHIPLLSTIVVFVLLYAAAAWWLDRFFALRVFVNFFETNSFLGIIAVGMTFVILSGGIDLSVGSVMALSGVVAALLMNECGVSPPLAIVAALAAGTLLGALMGCLIHYFDLAPFIVTLGGLFFARGLVLLLCSGSLNISNRFYHAVTGWRLPLGGGAGVPLTALLLLAAVGVGVVVSVWTTFGRNVYAIGGNEEAALLMGVPVGRTKVMVYALSGLCAALGGVVYTFYASGIGPRIGVGTELEAIAAVVVGGTLLSGGVGYVFGTLIGVLILGVIKTAIDFMPWASLGMRGGQEGIQPVTIGLLLLFFILLQRLLARSGARRR